MVLKGERVIQEPSFQVDLHKMLNLGTGSSIATLERRNLVSSTFNKSPHKSSLPTTIWMFY
uniref:Uncharacterized protein n=1 Tax=Arundo donax TaxID=35708 RepID=A0A0A9GLN4_ARUDO